ncbi:hypothetical protein BaRGS_00014526 [Batillaria attramentaria]|uniref:Uncharacterized protein n=1 Tax=Batillaria attramentaria TaxID=370345 RepID=A0ABD0L554_9CAEN
MGHTNTLFFPNRRLLTDLVTQLFDVATRLAGVSSSTWNLAGCNVPRYPALTWRRNARAGGEAFVDAGLGEPLVGEVNTGGKPMVSVGEWGEVSSGVL